MILQALDQLYDRLAADPAYAVAPMGYSTQKVAFAVVLHLNGRLHGIQDVRDDSGRRPLPRQMSVPGQSKPPGKGINPCLLWDNSAYLLGHVGERRANESEAEFDKRRSRTAASFAALRERHLRIEREIDDPSFSAVCRFLEQWDPARCIDLPLLGELDSGFGVFKLIGESRYVHETAAVRTWWDMQQVAEDAAGRATTCLVTGSLSIPARVNEPKIKSVGGAQSSGALLVSFNCDAFTSYGKDQGLNAPISKSAAFHYCTALNAILSGPRSRHHRLGVGDTTVVFWTERPTVAEGWLADLLTGGIEEPQDDASLQQVRVLLKALRQGGGELLALGDDPRTPVYLLGLAPNAARLSVRFWHTDTLGALFDKLKDHHEAMRIDRQFGEGSKRPDPEFPPAWMLLRETAREPKDIPPLLAGALMRAILEGMPYPDALAHAVIRRVRADRVINYCRAAILKAWLIRKPHRQGGIPVSLDTERTDPAYRLGRLFAVLEGAQYRALGDVGASIRDRFYSSASATPAMVFPRLLRTYQHHLGKMETGAKVNFEKRAQEIIDGIDDMPAHLNLEAQAQFAIGYYHQRKALFDGAKKTESSNPEQE